MEYGSIDFVIKFQKGMDSSFILGFIASIKSVNVSIVLKLFYCYNFGLTLVHPNAEEQF